jgi:hypothetical protein
VTIHSRAARRAASPSIDLDKKLKKTTRDSESPSRPAKVKTHALAAHNGIQKRGKKGHMTRAQRLRHQKGLERGADNLDKMQVKVVKSLDKEKNIKDRSKGWEDVNGDGTTKKKKKDTASLDDVPGDADAVESKDREWVSDEDMDDTAVVAPPALQDGQVEAPSAQAEAPAAADVPLPVVEDELL